MSYETRLHQGRQDQELELLYGKGPTRLGIGTYDIAIVDTPPEEYGGSLPGVYLMAITDGTDAGRNLLTTLKSTPGNTEIMLVRVHRIPAEEWVQEVEVLERLTKRSLDYLDEPLPMPPPGSTPLYVPGWSRDAE